MIEVIIAQKDITNLSQSNDVKIVTEKDFQFFPSYIPGNVSIGSILLTKKRCVTTVTSEGFAPLEYDLEAHQAFKGNKLETVHVLKVPPLDLEKNFMFCLKEENCRDRSKYFLLKNPRGGYSFLHDMLPLNCLEKVRNMYAVYYFTVPVGEFIANRKPALIYCLHMKNMEIQLKMYQFILNKDKLIITKRKVNSWYFNSMRTWKKKVGKDLLQLFEEAKNKRITALRFNEKSFAV